MVNKSTDLLKYLHFTGVTDKVRLTVVFVRNLKTQLFLHLIGAKSIELSIEL